MTTVPVPSGEVDLGLAGLDPATADDAVNARFLRHSGADFAVEHTHRLRTSTILGSVDGRHIAALISRDQRAGTYTIRLRHTGGGNDARSWLAAQVAPTTARRAAATARGARTSTATLVPAAVSPAPAGRSTAHRR
ncbi:hypothetical protein [Kitasatospora sp. NPDC098663]|uniref:hypothetical protein n=1 Tax=Kitasatospora sp. NPDC098663 TaxID=3364096 RepID=UPI0037FCFBCA